MGETAALALLDKALSYSKAQETDIYLSAQGLGLSRFAGGAIHQNVAHSDITLNIRAVAGKRLGRATTNDLSDSGVQKAVDLAHQNALLMPEDPAFTGLPEPSPAVNVASWDEATALCSPEPRASIGQGVCLPRKEHGLNLSVHSRTGVHEPAGVTTHGRTSRSGSPASGGSTTT